MGLFRPSRRVTSPDGTEWELYVSKTALPPWREGGVTDFDPDFRVGSVVGIFDAIWGAFVAPLLRFLALFPVAVVRGRRSRAVRIEAVTWFPEQEVRLWTTTDALVQGVLDQVAAGLADGKFVEPEGCVYNGVERD
jgi:hypothetical protein